MWTARDVFPAVLLTVALTGVMFAAVWLGYEVAVILPVNLFWTQMFFVAMVFAAVGLYAWRRGIDG